jgi:hypothetical protein
LLLLLLLWNPPHGYSGSQCQHYSVPNTSSGTRVSLDLRVIREDHFVRDYIHPESRKQAADFKVGGHYTTTVREREWRRASAVEEGDEEPQAKSHR